MNSNSTRGCQRGDIIMMSDNEVLFGLRCWANCHWMQLGYLARLEMSTNRADHAANATLCTTTQQQQQPPQPPSSSYLYTVFLFVWKRQACLSDPTAAAVFLCTYRTSCTYYRRGPDPPSLITSSHHQHWSGLTMLSCLDLPLTGHQVYSHITMAKPNSKAIFLNETAQCGLNTISHLSPSVSNHSFARWWVHWSDDVMGLMCAVLYCSDGQNQH